MKSFLIFDFDGTIVNNVDMYVTIYNTLAAQRGFGLITAENRENLKNKTAWEIVRELDIPLSAVPLIIRSLRTGFQKHFEEIEVIPGMDSVLETFKKRGHRLAIVSSSNTPATLEFLKTHHLDIFDEVRTDIGVFGKARVFRQLLRLSGTAASEAIVIGDERRDIQAAHHSKLRAVAVTWGTNGREGLAREQPEFIIDTPAELLELAL